MSARTSQWPLIRKDLSTMKVPPNMLDYGRTRAAFSWDDARSALTGTPGAG
ncbi:MULTISPECIES: hypothetical protein [Paenarthrobacter]|uniref:hypothetical protein n=1 Tax=Paenarthrobacter TaxID=1742992 RepID=UPI000424C2E9|nr:hypothetical protein [Paenarthrobacter ureafaciens]AOY71613.1 Acetyl-coenzyme A synthetase [Arthrobacter sp. ZXY-2]